MLNDSPGFWIMNEMKYDPFINPDEVGDVEGEEDDSEQTGGVVDIADV